MLNLSSSRTLWLVAVTIALAFPTALRAQPPALSLPGFLAEVDSVTRQVEAATSADNARAISVPDSWRVDAPGQRIEVDVGWLRDALDGRPRSPEAWPARRSALVARLKALRDLSAAERPAADQQVRARAGAVASDILQRDEFARASRRSFAWLMLERVSEWLANQWDRLGLGRASGDRGARVFAWLTALLALAALGVWLIRVLKDRDDGGSLDLSDAAISRPRARELALKAAAAARAGDSRDAVRLAYHAALERLEETGAWRVDDARTPREYLPLLRHDDRRQALVSDLIRRFEPVWYGNRDAAPGDAEAVTLHLEVLGCLRPGDRAT